MILPRLATSLKRHTLASIWSYSTAMYSSPACSNAAAYQFNKSHCAAYGVTCYQTAYLKAHYPAEYLCAYLNTYMGDKQEDLIPYIQDAKKHEVKILMYAMRVDGNKFKKVI